MNSSKAKQGNQKHIVWVGGAARSGKTTTTKWLEEKYDFVRYYGDGGLMKRMEQAPPAQPVAYRWNQMFEDPSLLPPFFERSPVEIAEDLLALGEEQFDYALRDIEEMAADKIAVDAMTLRVKQVLEVADPQQIVFLFSTEEFQRRLWRQGGWHKNCITQCRNPAQAENNFIEGIILQSRILQQEIKALGCRIIQTGGVKSIDEMLESVRCLPGILA